MIIWLSNTHWANTPKFVLKIIEIFLDFRILSSHYCNFGGIKVRLQLAKKIALLTEKWLFVPVCIL